MKLTKATSSQVLEFIESTDGWKLVEDRLQKIYVFSNFTQAFAFMTAIAKYAEKHDHHPEWFNVYKTVKVDLITHEVSGISERDFCMANEMDSVARNMS